MKKLSHTWKQRRPRKEAHLNLNLVEKNFQENDSGPSTRSGEKGIEKHGANAEDSIQQETNAWACSSFSMSLNLDSLNFESQNELADIESKVQSSFRSDTLKESQYQKSPASSGMNRRLRDRISTPRDIKTDALFALNKNFVSPVLAKEQERLNHTKSLYSDIADASVQNVNEYTKLIDSWGLPRCIVDKYKLAGIHEIFDWQRDCLLTGKALDGGNLIYSAPTSAGKTLVAELLMIKQILCTKKKAMYVLPFVSVAREKMFYLQDLCKEAGICVSGYMGSQTPKRGFATTDVAVCTIEKANSLVNRLMEEKKMSTLGIIIIDEMHMIGDGQRGYLLELMLSKIRFLQGSEISGGDFTPSDVQVVGMSATLPNLGMLATWLNADVFATEYRPVPLVEKMKVGRTILDRKLQKISEINSEDMINGDEEHVIPLCLETIRDCCSVLIFCPTKQWCETLAATIARNLKRLLIADDTKETEKTNPLMKDTRTRCLDAVAIKEVLEQLKRSPVGLDKALAEVVSSGVSFHHAGLTFDERDVIEGAFRGGAIRVLVATSTLSSGVNLPARRVILRTPIFHGKLINALVYKQMSGRAGRKGVDSEGESILICKPCEQERGLKLLRSHLEPVYSCLIGVEGESDVPGMKRALLEIIAAGVASTRADVERYANCTYLKTCLVAKRSLDPSVAIQSAIQFLIDNEFIRVKNEIKEGDQEGVVDQRQGETFSSSQLGSATLASALSPDEALVVFRELQKARRCFVLENELHIVYQVMPIYIQSQLPQLDWHHYFNLFEKLPPQYKRVGEMVGVEEQFIARAIRGRIPARTTEQRWKLAVHHRFYSALALLELVNEIPLRTVSRRYNINKGLLQSLQSSASTFAGMVTKFCEKLGWRSLEMLIDQFQSRLSFGVTRELCDLVRISLLNGARARLMYNSGYHTVSAVAMASPSELTKLLENFAPFESSKNLQGESERELTSKKRVRSFWVTGRNGMTEAEAAEQIVDEAKELVRKDLAGLGVEVSSMHFLSSNHRSKATVKDDGMVGAQRYGCVGSGRKSENDVSVKQKADLTRKLDRVEYSRKRHLPPVIAEEQGSQRPPRETDCVDRYSIVADVKFRKIENEENAVHKGIVDSTAYQNLVDSKMNKGLDEMPPIKRDGTGNDIGLSGKIEFHQTETGTNSAHQDSSESEVKFVDGLEKRNTNRVDNHYVERDFCINVESHLGSPFPTVSNISHFDVVEPAVEKVRQMDMVGVGAKPLRETRRSEESATRESVGSIRNGSFNSSNDCSLDEENGSLILIENKDSNSLSESESKRDTTPELFSEMFWDDVELISTGRTPCANALDTVSPGDKDHDTSWSDVTEQRFNRRKENLTASDVRVTEKVEEIEDVLAESKGNGEEVPEEESCELSKICSVASGDSLEAVYDSNISIGRESFGQCDSAESERQSNDSFDLQLSESVVDHDFGSPELVNDPKCCSEKLREDRHLWKREDDTAFNDAEAPRGSEKNCESISRTVTERDVLDDHPIALVSNVSQLGFTKVKQKFHSQENDSELFMSGSESFRKALCAVDMDETSPKPAEIFMNDNVCEANVRVQKANGSCDRTEGIALRSKSIVQEGKDRLQEAKVIGDKTTVLGYEDIGGQRIMNRNNRAIETVEGKVVTEKLFGVREANRATPLTSGESMRKKIENRSQEKAWPGGNSNRSEERLGETKRRSSERIASKTIPTGGTEKFTIIDVACSEDAFDKFIEEWRGKDSLSFSVARVSQAHADDEDSANNAADIAGVAVCLGGNTAYFFDFVDPNSVAVDSLIEKATDVISSEDSQRKKFVFDAKEHYKAMYKSLGVELTGGLYDPKVAAWLLDPSAKEMTLQELALRHLPNESKHLTSRIGNSYDTGSIGLMTFTAVPPRLRSTIEAVLTYKLMLAFELRLVSEGLYSCFSKVEMPLTVILAKMEMDGFGFSTEKCDKLKELLRRRMNCLEANARHLASRPFSISSPEDVAQVLFIELGLPPSGETNVISTPKRGRPSRRTKHLSTAKGILDKLKALHPLPSFILEWRKVNQALTSVVYPLQRAKQFCESTCTFRIHPRCQFHTVTGRVIITEPCLQHIPKDFDFDELPLVRTKEPKASAFSNFEGPSGRRSGLHQHLPKDSKETFSHVECTPISMRSAFVPEGGNVLIAADYSQLELRIITHLSRDKRLLSILNNDGDVFRMIAAEINQCPTALVAEHQRQAAKHICYGIIYGMGPKALADKLKVSEEAANLFMEKFKSRFVGIQDYTRRTIECAKSKGFVVTMGGRRRYLSSINSTSAQARSQAERQAVNTSVQGSAADLVKMAMINIDKRISHEFSSKKKSRFRILKGSKYAKCNRQAPKLVLQLHDELIYECYAQDRKRFVEIMKTEMEQALKLAVRLPVKVKSGTSWGDMKESDR